MKENGLKRISERENGGSFDMDTIAREGICQEKKLRRKKDFTELDTVRWVIIQGIPSATD